MASSLRGVALEVQVIRAYHSYVRFWIDSLALRARTEAELLGRTSSSNLEEVRRQMARGKGIVHVTPHSGNWDWGSAWFALEGFPCTVPVERLEPEEVATWFVEQRRAVGVTPIFADDTSTVELIRTVKAGGSLAIVGDRDVTGNGLLVDFLGRHARIPMGPALISLRTGAPVIPAAIYQLPGARHHVTFFQPIFPSDIGGGSLREKVETLTRMIAEAYEKVIRSAPEQWHVFVPFFESELTQTPEMGADLSERGVR